MAPGRGPQFALAPKFTLKVTQLAFLLRARAVSVRDGHSRKETDHVSQPSVIRRETGSHPVLVNLGVPVSKGGRGRPRGPTQSHTHSEPLPALWDFWGSTPKHPSPTRIS